MHGTILLTAGTGKTSQRMIPFLQQSQIPFLLTSRNPPKACPGIQYVRFDYLDSRGWPNAFNVGCKPPVEAVYLIAPEAAEDSVTLVVDFVKYCVEDQGVKRFVMMTGSTITKEGPYMGSVWRLLDKYKHDRGIEYCFIKATWFMENFIDPLDKHAIRTASKIYSAAGSARIPFVACMDIAHMAYVLLTCPLSSPSPSSSPSSTSSSTSYHFSHESYRALGPELLSHDEAATILSESLGRPIEHINLSDEDIVQHYVENADCSQSLAEEMGELERRARAGKEEAIFPEGAVQEVTGQKAMSLREWLEVDENRKALL